MSIFSLLSVKLLEYLFPFFLVIMGATFGAFVTLLFTKQNKTDNSQLNKAQPTEPQAEPVATVAQPVVEETIEPVVEEVIDEQPTEEIVADESVVEPTEPVIEEAVAEEVVDEQPTVEEQPIVEEIVEPIVEESIVEEVEPTIEETIGESVDEQQTETPTEQPTEEIVAEEPVETVIEEPTVESPIETMEPTVEEIVEPIIEETADEVVEQEPVSEPVETPAEQPRNDDEADEGVMVIDGKEVIVRYKRSFTSKLMQSCDELKEYYTDFVNHALSHKKVKIKLSWPCAKISRGREQLATLLVKGKTMYVYLALDPEVARQTIKGTIKDVSSKKRYQDVPTLFKVKSTLSLRKAKVLFDAMVQAKGIEFAESCTVTTPQDFPYDTTENLIRAGLIKVHTLDGSPIEDGDILRTADFTTIRGATAQVEQQPTEEIVDETPVEPVEETADEEPQVDNITEDPTPAEVESDDGIMYIDEGEVLVRYNRSFASKLVQSTDLLKDHYAKLYNHILSYKKVKARMSWPCVKFNRGREKLAVLTVRGKSLYLDVALDVEVARQAIKGTIKDVSNKKRYMATPAMFKIKSDLALRRAIALIDVLMQSKGILLGEPCSAVTAQDYPYDTTENLIKVGLIKVRTLDGKEVEEGMIMRAAGFKVVKSVTVEQAHDMISDEVASTLVQTAPVEIFKEVGNKKCIINVDTLSRHFDNGETVSLNSLKQKGLVAKNVGHIKVLARGTLDKRLTVEANAFSLDAVKMIVLVGGTAIKR
ncbi:MAG: uL15 family ribosomal protein [Clostridia bacterium]|nr:uL15 family ribosomal protein [Clostridia bacterium]